VGWGKRRSAGREARREECDVACMRFCQPERDTWNALTAADSSGSAGGARVGRDMSCGPPIPLGLLAPSDELPGDGDVVW